MCAFDRGSPSTVGDTASLYAQEVWGLFQEPPQTEVFEHSNGSLLAFEFVVSEHGLAAGMFTDRITDRAAWRQVFSIHDMDGLRITDVDNINADWDPSATHALVSGLCEFGQWFPAP